MAEPSQPDPHRHETTPILATTVIGSYPQPAWLVDHDALRRRLAPRVPAGEIWRVAEPSLQEAQDDATVLAIRDQERAGLDMVTDGEIRRESWSNRFANALDGLDLDRPGTGINSAGDPILVPRVVGPIRRRGPVEVRDVRFLRANTDRPIRITVPGPLSLTRFAQDEYYGDERAVATAFAEVVNAEVKDLFAAGADAVQIDEPVLQSWPDHARTYGLEALDRALAGVDGTTAVHMCFGYPGLKLARQYPVLAELDRCAVRQVALEAARPDLDLSGLEQLTSKTIVLGVVSISDRAVEMPEVVAGRIRAALRYVPLERLMVAPDCGLKFLPRQVAFAKLQSMVEGARIVRAELGSTLDAVRTPSSASTPGT